MEPVPHILVVDDDREIRDLLSRFLEKQGMRVTAARDAREARRVWPLGRYHLVVLDLMMPGEPGLDFARWLRSQSDVPVVILTAMGEETDRIVGLELGADDYVAKPFTPALLRARVNAMLQRPRPRRDDTALHCGAGLVVEPQRREVTLAGSPVPLTPTEYALLAHLASNLSQVCSRAELVREIWGSRLARDAHLIDVHVANLRAKLRQRAEHEWIQTVRGVGYRLDPVHTAQPDT